MLKTSFVIDPILLEKAKIQAIKEKISFGELMRKLLEEYLNKRK